MEVICKRCGLWFEATRNRKAPETCESCRARRVQVINKCIIWHGHFASDLVTPLYEDGTEVLPGIRICGKSDCVNPNHVSK